MTAPTHYSSKDQGAIWPSPLAAQSNYNSYAKRHYAIYHVLKMCLVDGYDGKPAAGWVMLFDEIAAGTGRRYALTNASRSGVMYVGYDYYMHTLIHVCEGLPDLDSPINSWSGGYSPENGFSEKGHWLTLESSSNWGTPDSAFEVVANENACFVSLYYQQSFMRGYQSVNWGYKMPKFYMGAINGPDSLGTISAPELGNFIFVGGYLRTVSDNIGSSKTHQFGQYGSGSTFTSTRNKDGSPRTAPPKVLYSYPLEMTNRPLDPDQIVNVAALVRVYWGEKATDPNGYLTYKTPIFINIYSDNWNAADQIAKNFNGVGLYKPFVYEGKSYIAFSSPYRHLTPIVSLEEEDWS